MMATKATTHRGPRIAAARQAYERTAARRIAKRFYSTAAWRRLRSSVLACRPVCERCAFAEATEVHHRVEVRVDDALALDPGNLEALCKPCHSAESIRRSTVGVKPSAGKGGV